jgi:hypothetical protein
LTDSNNKIPAKYPWPSTTFMLPLGSDWSAVSLTYFTTTWPPHVLGPQVGVGKAATIAWELVAFVAVMALALW